jgi:hypothetical protein
VDTETAIHTQIEPRLVEVLGRPLANALLTHATLCYVTAVGGEAKRYAAFVHSICSDERLARAWGSDGVRQQEKDWLALLGALAQVEESDIQKGDDQ